MRNTYHSRRRGSIALEFALAGSFLVTLFVGVIEVGRLFQATVALDNAVRAGALYGSSTVAKKIDSSGITAATHEAAPSLGDFPVQSSLTCGCPNGDTGSCSSVACTGFHKYLSVTGSVSLQSITALSLFPESFNLSSTARIRLAQ